MYLVLLFLYEVIGVVLLNRMFVSVTTLDYPRHLKAALDITSTALVNKFRYLNYNSLHSPTGHPSRLKLSNFRGKLKF